VDNSTFNQFRAIIEKESGIHLSDEKRTLLSNRVQKRLRALKLGSPEEYLKIIELDVSGEELVELIDVVSTNVTYFYREHDHFTQLGKIFDRYSDGGKSKIRVWCAASSSGEEAYTISMIAHEHLELGQVDFKILATDICTRVLRKAVRGRYIDKQVEKLPAELKGRYLIPIDEDGEREWQVTPELARPITFKKLNLAEFPYPLKGPIDLIFCRNVMIYFDAPVRSRATAEFFRLLAPGGKLFLSLSENLLGFSHGFQSRGPAIYEKLPANLSAKMSLNKV
jgi:chemotaxis protein methyltransferase CheR